MLPGLGLSFDLQVFPHQLQRAAELIASEPEIVFILDHGGYMTLRTDEEDQLWLSGIRAIARHPNVSVKVSDYATVDPTFNLAGYIGFVRTLVDTFGPDRTMFASNFPTEGRIVSYHDLVVAFGLATRNLSSSERTRVFSETAARVYRL